MPILDKIFGGGWDRIVERARRLEQDGNEGEALVEYERALASHRQGVEAAAVREVEARATAIRDGIAERHAADGRRWLEEGDLEQAEESFKAALQAAGTEAKEAEIRALMGSIEAEVARRLAGEDREPGEEEIYQALSGGWEEEQYDEYDGLGVPFRRAFLDYHAGRPDQAVPVYEKLLDESGEDAVFLLFELGRARAAMAVRAGGEEAERIRRLAVDALDLFLERLPEGVATAVRAGAWNELAQIHLERKDPEAAEDALMRAQEAVPGEPAAYLNLGRFLRSVGRDGDAVEALEEGAEVMDKLRPDFRLLGELGVAYAAVGRTDEAMRTLESIVGTMRHIHDGYLDPSVAIPLAALYEQKGRRRDACDLFRHLAEGQDAANHGEYCFHAARLLVAMGEHDVASRYVARARELLKDAELLGRLDELAK